MFLQLGATICLGLFCPATVSQLRFLGVKSAGPWIALFGGLLTVFNGIAASANGWTMIRSDIAAAPSVLVGFYFLAYAFGGPGFSIPVGLLMAGVSVSAGFAKLLPKWIILLGLLLAGAGELSWFHFISPGLLFLIPLVRFPGFIWIIAVGFALPRIRPPRLPFSREGDSEQVATPAPEYVTDRSPARPAWRASRVRKASGGQRPRKDSHQDCCRSLVWES